MSQLILAGFRCQDGQKNSTVVCCFRFRGKQSTHQAIMLWNALRSYSHWKQCEMHSGAAIMITLNARLGKSTIDGQLGKRKIPLGEQ